MRSTIADGVGDSGPQVRIRALGGFQVVTPDAPDGIQARSRSKPLELLRLLAAWGGEGLPVQLASDTLWPDSDGDRARWAFATTLRRLRGMIGPEAIRLGSAQLSLDWSRCSLDVREFAARLEAARMEMEGGRASEAAVVLGDALRVYHGPLLLGASETGPVVAARERLHQSLLRLVRQVGSALDEEPAIALYRQALEAEPTAEWIYLALMGVLARAGRRSEAIALYERCRRLLEAQLGSRPGADMEDLRRALETPVFDNWRALPSLAVEPFESQVPGDSWFAAGITYDLKLALTKINGIIVYQRPVVPDPKLEFAPGRPTNATISAQYVVTGAVRHLGERVRINVMLTRAADGEQVWAERYDRQADELHTTLDEIVAEVVTGLQVHLVEGDQARIWNRALRKPDARECFYRGVAHFWTMAREQHAMAREQFARVIALEPDSPLGYGYMAWTHLFEIFAGWSTDRSQSRVLAEQFCEQALAVDQDGLSLHAVLSHLHLLDGDEERSIECALAGLRLRPSCSISYAFLAHALLYLGRPREAVARAQMALRLARVCPPWYFEIQGWGYLLSGFHEQAAQVARQVLRSEPQRLDSQLLLAAALHANGHAQEARQTLAELRSAHADFDLNAYVEARPAQGPRLFREALGWMEAFDDALGAGASAGQQ